MLVFLLLALNFLFHFAHGSTSSSPVYTSSPTFKAGTLPFTQAQ